MILNIMRMRWIARFNSNNQDMGEKRKKQLNDLVLSLENELTEQLYSHKIFLEDINRIEEEKNLGLRYLIFLEKNAKFS
jgi:hypothetical protein